MISASSNLIQASGLNKFYKVGNKQLNVLENINISINQGETLGLVGESGCGKSTLGKLLLNYEKPSAGSIYFKGKKFNDFSKSEIHLFKQLAQMIFQDPYASLNPRMSIKNIVGEGLDIHCLAHGKEREELISQALNSVGLDSNILNKYPHEFSGGQRQRIVIARAMVINPQFVVCDEPISSLDACTQKQVMALLLQFKKEKGLTYLFISHDLHAVHEISDRVAVMYLGKIVEQAPTNEVFSKPMHPYTQALLSAVPIPNPEKERKRLRILLNDELPGLFNPPSGCPFHPRCKDAMALCQQVNPSLKEVNPGKFVACHKYN